MDLTAPSEGHDFSDYTGYLFKVSVVDADGLVARDEVFVQPEEVDLSFETDIPGGGVALSLDQIPRMSPFVYDTAIGFRHTISAPETVSADGYLWGFDSWSTGEATNEIELIVPEENANYVAHYVNLSNEPPVADAGPDQAVDEGDQVTLDGTGSADPDGAAGEEIYGIEATETNQPGVYLFEVKTGDINNVRKVKFYINNSQFGSQDLKAPYTWTWDSSRYLQDSVLARGRVLDSSGTWHVVEAEIEIPLQSTPGGAISTWEWVQTGGPGVSLQGADTATPSFVAPQVDSPTLLEFTLTVTDDQGAQRTDTVEINVGDVPEGANVSPTADAGPDQNVDEGDTVNLDGSGSSDSDGNIETYAWEQTGGPDVGLTGVNSSTPSFVAPNVNANTVLEFTLTVTDNEGAPGIDTIEVTVSDVPTGGDEPPIADAGPDQTVNEGDQVTLDGTGSTDPDGQPGEGAFTVVVTETNQSGVYSFEVKTGDINNIRKVKFYINGSQVGSQDLKAPYIWTWNSSRYLQDSLVARGRVLDTSGKWHVVDVEIPIPLQSGTGGAIASWDWLQTGGPNVDLDGDDTATPSFVAPEVDSLTLLEFTLTVTDDQGDQRSDTVEITVNDIPPGANVPPTADAGPDQSVDEGDTVYLDGASSADIDGNVETYSWEQTGGPDVGLSGENTATPSFAAPDVGSSTVLEFTLTVTDNEGAPGTDKIEVTVRDISTGGNEPPVADAGADQAVDEGAQVALDGSSSVDPDGGPAPDAFTIVATESNLSGVYLFEVKTGNIGSVRKVKFYINNSQFGYQDLKAPYAWTWNSSGYQQNSVLARGRVLDTSGQWHQVEVEIEIPLQPAGAGAIAIWDWVQTGGPTVSLNGADTATPSFVAPQVDTSTLFEFTLTVTDDQGAATSDTVEITVRDVSP